MKTIKKLVGLCALMTLFVGQVQGQEYIQEVSPAYSDSGNASYLSAALPIGALVVAAIIIATTDRHHHHGSNGGSGSNSSSSHFHASSYSCY